MDRKSLAVLVVSFGLLMLWYPLVTRVYGPKPGEGTNVVAAASNSLSSASQNPAVPSYVPSVTTVAPAGSLMLAESTEETVSVENEDARYIFTTRGGGLKLVELKKYPEVVGRLGRKILGTNNVATLNTDAPVPAFTLLGSEAVLGDGVFKLTRIANGLRADKVLSNGLYLVKEFQLGTNYLLTATIRFENRTNGAVRLPVEELVIGTATPLGPRDNGLLMAMEWYNGHDADRVNEPWFANKKFLRSSTPRTEYLAGNSNVVWASVQNQFFAMIAAPASNAPVWQVLSRQISLPPPTAEDLAVNPKANLKPYGFQTAFLYPETTLNPGQVLERRYDIFAGPKEYKTLDHLAARLGNNMDLVMGFDMGFGGKFIGFFAKLLLLSMNGIHSLLHLSYALCIIAITIVIKLVFWPLTTASTRSMKRMAALQPQMKALQAKYKDDPRKMQQKMSEFWKEHKVNPAAGCLPVLVQFPIFIGFYRMLQSAIELRGASFLWAPDLSQPDTVWIIPGVNFPLNPLPLIYGATMIWQARLTPPAPGMDPAQQQMMKYMPVIFLFILYYMPAGLTLYWTVQNLLTIAQTKLTRANDAAAAGKALVPARPVPATRPMRKKK